MWYDAYERKIAQLRTAAIYYIEYKWSMKVVAENIGVGESTIRRWFNHDLKYIDYALYIRVQKKKAHNIKVNRVERDSKGRFSKEW